MSEKAKSRLNLASIGGICILAGLLAGMFGPTPQDQSAAIGQFSAVVLFILVGIGLIIVFFVRDGDTKRHHAAGHTHSGKSKKHSRRHH